MNTISAYLNWAFLPTFLFSIIRMTTPLIYAAMGAIISHKAGFNNLALESMMLTSAFTAVIASAYSQSAFIGLLGGLAGAFFIAAIICLTVLKFKTDLYLTCLSLNMMSSYGTTFCMYVLCKSKITTAWELSSKTLPNIDLPIIKDIPFIGEVLSGHHLLTYMAALFVFLMWFLLYRTRIGLRIRSVGEKPEAAESVGINVNRIKAISFFLSAAFSALGGIYMSMGYVSWFNKDMVAGRGFIGNAANNLSGSEPVGGALYSLMFGVAQAIGNVFVSSSSAAAELILMFPYVVTIIALAISSTIRMRRERQRLGLN